MLWNHYNPLTDYSTATVVIDWVKNYKFLLQSRLGLFLYKESLSHIMALQWIMKHFIKSHCHCPWSGNRFSMLFFKRTSLAQHWISFYTILFWKSKISRCDIEFVCYDTFWLLSENNFILCCAQGTYVRISLQNLSQFWPFQLCRYLTLINRKRLEIYFVANKGNCQEVTLIVHRRVKICKKKLRFWGSEEIFLFFSRQNCGIFYRISYFFIVSFYKLF